MADYNSALNGVSNMQQVVQEGLPVIPNNGNPGGAYNMPHAPQLPGQPQPVVAQPMTQPQLSDRYPWLRPTQSMDNVRNLLASRRQATLPPAAIPQQLQALPLLPQARGPIV